MHSRIRAAVLAAAVVATYGCSAVSPTEAICGSVNTADGTNR